jgi:hypothetical protein
MGEKNIYINISSNTRFFMGILVGKFNISHPEVFRLLQSSSVAVKHYKFILQIHSCLRGYMFLLKAVIFRPFCCIQNHLFKMYIYMAFLNAYGCLEDKTTVNTDGVISHNCGIHVFRRISQYIIY